MVIHYAIGPTCSKQTLTKLKWGWSWWINNGLKDWAKQQDLKQCGTLWNGPYKCRRSLKAITVQFREWACSVPQFAYKDPPFLQIQIRAVTTVRLSEETAHAFLTLHYTIIQFSKDLVITLIRLRWGSLVFVDLKIIHANQEDVNSVKVSEFGSRYLNHIQGKKKKYPKQNLIIFARRQQDSNLRRQSPTDFESVSLTTRTYRRNQMPNLEHFFIIVLANYWQYCQAETEIGFENRILQENK